MLDLHNVCYYSVMKTKTKSTQALKCIKCKRKNNWIVKLNNNYDYNKIHLKQLHFFQKLTFFLIPWLCFQVCCSFTLLLIAFSYFFCELIAILSHSHHSYSIINYKTFFFSIHSRYVILCFYIFLMGFWRKIKFYYTFMNIIYTSSCLWWIKQKCHWPRPLLIVHLDICNCFYFILWINIL